MTLVIGVILGSVLLNAHSAARACSTDWSATYAGSSPWLILDPGAQATVTMTWQNTGCRAWNVNDPGAAGSQGLLGTWNPDPGQDLFSPLGGGCSTAVSWFSCNRIRPTADIVNPGDYAQFTFGVVAPPAPGIYQLHVRPLIEGRLWMEDQGTYWQTTVSAPVGYSVYESQVDARIPVNGTPAGAMYIQGCRAGGDTAALYGGPYTSQTGVVVLDFGQPYYDPAIGYGTWNYSNLPVSNAQILAAAEAWATGYYDCSPPSAPIVTVVVGTNNCGNGTGPLYECNVGDNVNAAQGAAWGQLALSFKNWLAGNGLSRQIMAGGGIDAELAWNTPANTSAWACTQSVPGSCNGGYGSVPGTLFYDYGDAAGCPPYGTCINGWQQQDVWWLSWGAPPAEPLPEIYNDANAQEWQQIKMYAYNTYQQLITIRGEMTQEQACGSSGCPGLDNTPQQGWLDLWKHLLYDDDYTAGQQLLWSTDITHAN